MRRRLAAALFLLVLALAGCAGSDAPTVVPSETATETETSAPTPAPTPEPTPAPSPAAPEPTAAPAPTPAEPDAADDEEPEAEPTEAAETRTFELSLNGDGVDGSCSWGVDEDEFFYEIRYPEGYTVGGNPVTLVAPDGGTVASEGQGIRVTGRLAPDQAPSCDVGTVLIAESVEPL